MPRRKDGDQGPVQSISARDVAAGLFGRREVPGDRAYDEATDTTHVTIPAEVAAGLFRGAEPQPTRRDGITVQFRGGFNGPIEILRFNRIAEARAAAEVTTGELAEAAFIPEPALIRYEAMEEATDIPAAARDNLAGALGQPVAALFPERRAGAGLPSLAPVPPRDRTGDNFDQGAHDRAAVLRGEIEQATNDHRRGKLETKLRNLQADLARAERGHQAALRMP